MVAHIVFFGCCLAGSVFTLLLPEVKGRDADAIDAEEMRQAELASGDEEEFEDADEAESGDEEDDGQEPFHLPTAEEREEEKMEREERERLSG